MVQGFTGQVVFFRDLKFNYPEDLNLFFFIKYPEKAGSPGNTCHVDENFIQITKFIHRGAKKLMKIINLIINLKTQTSPTQSIPGLSFFVTLITLTQSLAYKST